jgi:hypothetical protein
VIEIVDGRSVNAMKTMDLQLSVEAPRKSLTEVPFGRPLGGDLL